MMLGDRVAAILKWLGFEPWKECGCKRRQDWLNRLGLKLRVWWPW